jgi:hypothetical protein
MLRCKLATKNSSGLCSVPVGSSSHSMLLFFFLLDMQRFFFTVQGTFFLSELSAHLE